MSREKWTVDENIKLLRLYKIKQNHWKEISSELIGRTDNAAKNQFFALMRKGLRKACRTIGFTSNTVKINGLKPKVLLDFFQLERGFLVNGELTLVNVADFIEHYTLSDLPDNFIDRDQSPFVTEIMSYLTQAKSVNQQRIHGLQEIPIK